MIPASFYTALQGFSWPNIFNPWREYDPHMDLYSNAWLLRQRRLTRHFDVRARYLLIGEAPGYQGCRYSGVPFTSERLIIEGEIPRVSDGYQFKGLVSRITQRQLPWSEPSATIVWKALRMLQIHEQAVCWNAFPWHPHKPGEPLSNRTPAADEMSNSTALQLLDVVVRSFPSAVVVSVGKLSTQALQDIGCRPFHRVRHPANGGASLFRKGLTEVVG